MVELGKCISEAGWRGEEGVFAFGDFFAYCACFLNFNLLKRLSLGAFWLSVSMFRWCTAYGAAALARFRLRE